jgi:hypothetical protein
MIDVQRRRSRLSVVRIVLVGMPVLLQEITRVAVQAQPWAEIVGEYSADVPLVDAVRAPRANVAIVGAAPGVELQAHDVLEASRSLCVLSISDDGRQAVLHELRPKQASLGEVSVDRLVERARGAVSVTVEA